MLPKASQRLGGSCVVRSRGIGSIAIGATLLRILRTLLLATPEPPSHTGQKANLRT